MIIPQDALFREESERFALRWNCEDCQRFMGDDAEGQGHCAHGFPTERHRRKRYEDPAADVLFCKEFELA